VSSEPEDVECVHVSQKECPASDASSKTRACASRSSPLSTVSSELEGSECVHVSQNGAPELAAE
jgi:hypothetical protein